MQKNILKQKFENFCVSNSKGLDKGYDRFQRLLSLLEINGACVSTDDANQKFLRSLLSAWSNTSLIIRNKPSIDNLDIDDLYNNLKVYEADIKGSSGSFSNSQNVAFVSTESTNNTNELNDAYSVFIATGHSSQTHGIADQPRIQGTRVEMLGMHDTEEEIMSYQVEEEATDFALMAFTSNPSSSSSSNSEEEVTETVFDNHSSDEENIVANDRFKKVFTRSGRIPVSAAKPVITAGPKQSVNFSRTRSNFHKSHSPVRSHPQQALKNKGIVNSGCSRHMTGNKAYLDDYQEIHDGGFVAFGSSRGKITGKVTNDFSRFSWGFFLATKDETSEAEAVNTACYVLNRALVTKTHNKTSYELLNGKSPRLDFMRSFGCPVTILNTLNPLGKFEGTQDNVDVGKEVSDQHYIVLPLWSSISSTYQSSDDKHADDKPKDDTGSKTVEELVNKEDQAYRDELNRLMSQEKEASDAADALRKEFKQRCMDQRGVTQAGSINSFVVY
uniref:Uncharacterized protein n=1 Tax=Tanacetum cinerariifolium TaxID=118510 RepID=A0A6L2LKQ6_TANCI|nr:hypothetical protein [Tanacetum cinerariifolium]GEV14523.1 hypothetical protein [Tanacetum cinerariifolium]